MQTCYSCNIVITSFVILFTLQLAQKVEANVGARPKSVFCPLSRQRRCRIVLLPTSITPWNCIIRRRCARTCHQRWRGIWRHRRIPCPEWRHGGGDVIVRWRVGEEGVDGMARKMAADRQRWFVQTTPIWLWQTVHL